MKTYRSIFALAFLCMTIVAQGQVLSHDAWQQNNVVTLKMSQLYYEANLGCNVRPKRHMADFVYLAFGYGKPTKKNAWRKFVPENEIRDSWPKSLKEKLSQVSTDDLYAGKVSVGCQHWFNHFVGFYAQAGWGFIVDLSASDDFTDQERVLLSEVKEKGTFIYNTVPVELGLTMCLWSHFNVQAGVTYMWKEIPLLTIGVGYAF